MRIHNRWFFAGFLLTFYLQSCKVEESPRFVKNPGTCTNGVCSPKEDNKKTNTGGGSGTTDPLLGKQDPETKPETETNPSGSTSKLTEQQRTGCTIYISIKAPESVYLRTDCQKSATRLIEYKKNTAYQELSGNECGNECYKVDYTHSTNNYACVYKKAFSADIEQTIQDCSNQ